MPLFGAVVCDLPRERQGIAIDEGLLSRIGRGEREAFRQLYELAGNAVYAYALSILRSREDAEDAMQETFLKIRAAAHLYVPMGRPMAWILTITRNICMMRFRRERHASPVPFDELEESPDCSDIENREDRMVLETAFRVLSEQECQIITLHIVGGMKHREISEWMKLPISTVLSRYHRGLKKLRTELEGVL